MPKYIQIEPNHKVEWRRLKWKGEVTDYEVSEFGSVRHHTTKKQISQHTHWKMSKDDEKWYIQVAIRINGIQKHIEIQRLVAAVFLEEPTMKDPVVDHIDNNPHNNHFTNLQYLSRGDNWSKSRKKKVTMKNIKSNVKTIYESISECARHHKIPYATFWKMIENQTIYQDKYLFTLE